MTVQHSLFSAGQTAIGKDDWYTPKWIFDTLGITFDLDVAAPPGGIEWIPTRRYLTMAEDGLATPWKGRVWMNPPFSRILPWITKFTEHRNGIALLPMAHAQWFSDLWNTDCSVVALPGNLKFQRNGKAMGMFFSCALFAFGADNQQALSKIGKVR